ncbi:MAG: CTP synthase [Puniceicoccaceae bacterium]
MKYIFVTGGVVSSLGKGLTAAALGALLEQRGLRIKLQKFDPYLNVDPGTMNPFQHGEVYVLDDGAETDLDLGHYERFTNCRLSRRNNLTSGQVYESVLKKERLGEYLGKTVQVIPHVTDEIKANLYNAGDEVDVLITEIGGTIGDIEGLPFLEAMRQFALEVGKANVLFIHVTLLPYIKAAGELKSKPSQQSVAKMREIGIQPDILVCRTEHPLDMSIRQKLSMFCNVPVQAVIEEQDVESSIYELPLMLQKENLDTLVVNALGITNPQQSMDEWRDIVRRLKFPAKRTTVGVVGKYIELQDAYKSVYESLTHAGIAHDCEVNIVRLDAESFETEQGLKQLDSLDGIVIPGGFGGRGIEGKINAARYAREHNIPYFGLCLGLHILTIEFARNVLGLEKANSHEFDEHCPDPVIYLMEEQKDVTHKGASMRLGAYQCELIPGTHSAEAYGKQLISERHRHRYEFNSAYTERFAAAGLRVAGINPERGLVEIAEIAEHPFMVGVQFHPEFQSKPNAPHPLFRAFVGACLQRKEPK